MGIENRTASGATETAGLSPRTREMVRDVFSALEKALKICRLYEPNHDLHRQAEADVVGRFERAIDALEVLHLEITPESFNFGGQAILRQERSDGSIPYKLFRDGIRSITFTRGLNASELRKLLVVLQARPNSPGHLDEDMATLLWRQNFRHVSYVCVDEIEIDDEGIEASELALSEDDVASQVDLFLGAISSYIPESLAGGEGTVSVAAERMELYELERRRLPRGVVGEAAGDIIAGGDEAERRLRAEIEADDTASLIERVVDIILDVLREQECELSSADVHVLLGQFLTLCLGRGDFPALNRMLGRLRAEGEGSNDSRVTGLTDGLLEGLADEDAMDRTAEAIRNDYSGGPGALEEYLSRLPASAMASLARIGRAIEEEPERGVIRRILVRHGRESPEALIDFLQHDSPEDVQVALGRMSEEARTREFITELLARVETQTAIEVVKVIGTLRLLDRPALLEQVLRDPRPSVRRAALRVTEHAGGRSLIPLLIELLEQDDADEQDRLRLYHAIAALGGARAVEYLNEHLGPKKRFQRLGRRAAEFRHRVLLSLGDVADTGVRMYLREGISSKDKRFAEACRIAVGGASAPAGEGP